MYKIIDTETQDTTFLFSVEHLIEIKDTYCSKCHKECSLCQLPDFILNELPNLEYYYKP